MSTVKVTCGHVELGRKVVCEGCFNALKAENEQLQALVVGVGLEHEKARKELERLSGKTGFCVLCEGSAKEVERLRSLSNEILNNYTMMANGYAQIHRSHIQALEQALSGREGRG